MSGRCFTLYVLCILIALMANAEANHEDTVILKIANKLLTSEFQRFFDGHVTPQLEESRRDLIDMANPIFTHLQDVKGMVHFMKSHVFAVWDFMSLVTAMQQQFTSVEKPWAPKAHPLMARFVNEVKLHEETDIIGGIVSSHFEYYLRAMRDMGVNTDTVLEFVEDAHSLGFEAAIEIHEHQLPAGVKDFMTTTFSFVRGSPHELIASFVFGRETLIPDMFTAALHNIDANEPRVEKIRVYMERHVEVDGDIHGTLGIALLKLVCGDDMTKWSESIEAGKQSLKARKLFYESMIHSFEFPESENNSTILASSIETTAIVDSMLTQVCY